MHPTVQRFLTGAAIGSLFGLFSKSWQRTLHGAVLGGLGYLTLSTIGETVVEFVQEAGPKKIREAVRK